ncbi:MAG: AAA family ATPase [Bacteroides sp.]|nr:AAA family ATPase [Bacteroides sp.]
MTQLLKINSRFAGRVVVRKLSTRHDGVREVYLTKWQEGVLEKLGILTVFNLKSKRYEVDGASRKRVPDFIEEVKFLRNRQSDRYFPRVIDCGIERVGTVRLGWMLQHNIDANSLTKEIKLQRGLCMSDVVKVMDVLFSAVDELTRYTRGGGHYNITTDNILLDYDGNDLKGVYLIGLSDMGTSYNGLAPFTDGPRDTRFRAPETINGVFNSRTDIYALGIVLTMMISGDVGEDEIDNTDSWVSAFSPVEFRQQFMKRSRDTLSAAQRLILEKATDVNPNNRFQTVDRFRTFVNKLAKGSMSTQTHVERAATLAAGTGRPSAGGLDEVAGMSELKALFRRDFIRIVRNPKVAQAYGIKPSNCTLLYGPQGCGKTFIAEKAAQESGLKYKVVNPSELGSIYIHGSQQKIAELFDEAEKKGPMILIFDEFDAIVPKREADRNGNQANEVNEMLTQLNNCASRGIYVLATTNRPGLLDPAIMRKGRVDRMVYVSLPDNEARKELFRLEIEKRPFVEIDYEELAAVTENFTCSDISYIVEEAARLCFEETLDRGLDDPLPLSMNRMMEVIKVTRSSVSEQQRREYLELKDEMENRQSAGNRKKVGFIL